MSRSYLVCYAAGAPVHFANRARLVASAVSHGIDEIIACGPDDIEADYRDRHAGLFAMVEGVGCWLWKPYVILRTLQRSAPGDAVYYVDSGAYLRRPPDALWRGGTDAVFFENDYLARHYTKRDAFILTGTDSPTCHGIKQLDAAMLAFRNTPASRHFVATWLQCCEDPRMLSDIPNTCGAPNLPGYVAHRHDQALLTLLLWRDGRRLSHVIYRRARKHRFIVHHRRRSSRVPIWWWHLWHDGAEALARRLYDFETGRK